MFSQCALAHDFFQAAGITTFEWWEDHEANHQNVFVFLFFHKVRPDFFFESSPPVDHNCFKKLRISAPRYSKEKNMKHQGEG